MTSSVWDTPTNDEGLLLDYARRTDKRRKGRRAVRIYLSRLKPHNRREHHLRIAASTFEVLIRKFDGALFKLFNKDLVVVCNGAQVSDIDACVLRIRYLFSEDPLFRDGEADDGDDPFCDWYDLENDYPQFLAQAEQIAEERTRHDTQSATQVSEDQRPKRHDGPPLGAPELASVIGSILNADLSSMLRRQPVCAVVRGQKPQALFNELYISVETLRQTLMPTHDLLGNRWLFQELTRHLDRRMMHLLTHRKHSAINHAFSLNLNIETLVSTEFLEFDAALNSATKRTIVVELQFFDVVADLKNYHFARGFLHDRGYRICLDGATCLSLPLIDREQLGLDLIKMQWNKELVDHSTGRQDSDLRRAAGALTPGRLILYRCDSEDALEFGRSLGVTMYQGYQIDRMLTASPSRAETVQAMTKARARHRAATRA
jgi:EAL domain-containing protein (putative c-di-GMP-specific phosphodiesterase class I)